MDAAALAPDPLYIALASAAILSPGPGVALTLSNAARYGYASALGGILGIGTGSAFIAALSATGLGLLIAATPEALTTIKYAGALYLVYLGWLRWNSPPPALRTATHEGGMFMHYREGAVLQLSNPKALVFFIALFPRFLEGAPDPTLKFAVLIATYALLLVLIHSAYALVAQQAQRYLTGQHASVFNKGVALCFVGFAIAAVM